MDEKTLTAAEIRRAIAELRNGEYDRPGGGYQYRTAYLTALLDVENALANSNPAAKPERLPGCFYRVIQEYKSVYGDMDKEVKP